MNLDQFLVADSFETAGVGAIENFFLNRHLAQATGNFYFEAGAVNGFHMSQTATLESRHRWRGVLVEAHRETFARLETGRPANECVCAVLGDGSPAWFEEKTSGHFGHSQIREEFVKDCRRVETVTVEQVLTDAQAPKKIDFCVLDVEKAWRMVWDGVDFKRRRFGFFAIEMKGAGASAVVDEMAGQGYRLDAILGGEDFIFLPA